MNALFDLSVMHLLPAISLVGAFTFTSGIPKKYESWKKTGNSMDFAHWFSLILLSAFMAFFSFGIYATTAFRFLNGFSSSQGVNGIIILATALLYILIPSINVFYQKFKKTKKDFYFSLSILMIMIVLFFLTLSGAGLFQTFKFLFFPDA